MLSHSSPQVQSEAVPFLDTNRPAADLVDRAKRHPEAFGELYDQHVGDIYRFVSSRVGNRALAEDITSEVFFKALKNIGRYTERGRPFLGWLYKIAANQIADHYRRSHPALDLADAANAADGRTVLDEVIQRDEIRRVQAAIDRLPPAQRLAMKLQFSDDRSRADAARIMGRSEGAVKLLIYRSVHRLRRDLASLACD